MRKILYTLPVLMSLVSCNKSDYELPTENLNSQLTNSTWIITRYDHALASQPTYVSDTIHFISYVKYTINESSLERSYKLTGSSTCYLRMYSLTTLGSDFSSTLDKFIIDEGEINSAIFNDLHVADSLSHGYVLIWMNRID